MMSKEPEIQDVSPQIAEAIAASKVCRTTFEGIEEMRGAGEAYLPRNPRETPDAYKVRLARTDFFPALQHAVFAYIGKPLGSPIVVTGAPAIVEAGLSNIDLAGNDLDSWARCSLTCGLVDGMTFAVADYPVVMAGSTLAQERAIGARPYLVHVPLENVIEARFAMINGAKKLVHFRYKECHVAPAGRWGSAEVERIRVLEPGTVEVWEAHTGADGKVTYVLLPELSGPVSIPEVPVAKFSAMAEDEPPLVELANLNVRWWQTKSEQNHTLHTGRVQVLTADEDRRPDTTAPIEIGVDGIIVGFVNLRYLEITGAALEQGWRDIADTEDRMRRVAGQALDAKVKTATEAGQDSKDNESQLRAWASNYKSFLDECLRLMALWIGEKDGGTAQLDMEWDEVAVGADVIAALANARTAGLISAETYLWNMQRADILPPDVTIEEEVARLEMEAPAPMPLATPFGRPAPMPKPNPMPSEALPPVA